MKPLVNSDTIIFYGSIALLAIYACHDIGKPKHTIDFQFAPVKVNIPPTNNYKIDWFQFSDLPKPDSSFLNPKITSEINDVATQCQQIKTEKNV